jgi:hypothetical protein
LRRLLTLLAFAALASLPGLSHAAIIGPTNDWKPLREGARQLGISSRMVDRILAAGLEVMCPGTVHDNGGVLNGWLLGGDSMSFYTNAHGIIDIGRMDHKANFIEPLDQCGVRSYRDLAAHGAKAQPYPIAVPQNRRQMELASFTPQSDSPTRDRARLRLLHAIAGARALALPDFGRIKLSVGQEVIMVSLQPPAMRTPEIQACHIQSINLGGRIGPGQLFTDCDNGFGNSAALYFVRDPADRTMLLPIALHEGCHERVGDHQPWDLNKNTALALILGNGFFSFGRS